MTKPDSMPTSTPDAPVLTIWHTYESGTILGGTSKGDAASQALGHVKRGGLGWKWSSNIVTPDDEYGAWYIRYSREKLSKNWEIDQAVKRLEGLGYRVELKIDNTPRDLRESEADRAQHMEERADALDNKAGRFSSQSDGYRKRWKSISDHIPFGQPILVGHHSERRHRRDLDRIHNWQGKEIELGKAADRTADKAESARRHMDFREAPLRVARRITQLEADLRGWQRERAGRKQWHTNDEGKEVYGHVDPSPASAARSDEQIAHYENQLTYWRGIREEQIAKGVATNFTKDDIAKGDRVKYGGLWYVVARVNKLSVSVQTDQKHDGSWYTSTVRFDQLQEHRIAAEVAELKAAKAQAIDLDTVNAPAGGDNNG